jgi:signal transduction histidine kinase
LRHAGASRAEVLVRVTGSEVFLRVRDDGRGGPATGTGQGIVGMRERADLVGGQLLAGPRAGGGFEVSGRLPLGEAS